MDKTKIDDILTDINYYERFKNNFLNTQYNEINYGPRKGAFAFKNLLDAVNGFDKINNQHEHKYALWDKIMQDPIANAEQLLCATLEIFNWGAVLPGNAITAIELYKNNKLKDYIEKIGDLLKNKSILCEKYKNEILWSSGWTKVYSFINNDIIIYDSRVSAFLNYTLIYKLENTHKLSQITNYLFNFGGNSNRQRTLPKNLGFINSHPSDYRGLNANIIASWIIQLLIEKLQIDTNPRIIERAFFMLGFDLNEINKS